VDTRRSTVMRKMLWDTYVSSIQLTKDGASFEAAARGAKGPSAPRELRYEDVHAVRVKAARSPKTALIRANDRALIEWHARMHDAGYFDAYDRWLFDRPTASFADYCRQNGAVCGRLESWLANNPLPVAAAEPGND
jgi:hypothetical protein